MGESDATHAEESKVLGKCQVECCDLPDDLERTRPGAVGRRLVGHQIRRHRQREVSEGLAGGRPQRDAHDEDLGVSCAICFKSPGAPKLCRAAKVAPPTKLPHTPAYPSPPGGSRYGPQSLASENVNSESPAWYSSGESRAGRPACTSVYSASLQIASRAPARGEEGSSPARASQHAGQPVDTKLSSAQVVRIQIRYCVYITTLTTTVSRRGASRPQAGAPAPSQ